MIFLLFPVRYNENLCLKMEEEVNALVAMDFLRAMRTAMLTPNPACALRNMCEVNRSAVTRGDLGDVIAEVFRSVYMLTSLLFRERKIEREVTIADTTHELNIYTK